MFHVHLCKQVRQVINMLSCDGRWHAHVLCHGQCVAVPDAEQLPNALSQQSSNAMSRADCTMLTLQSVLVGTQAKPLETGSGNTQQLVSRPLTPCRSLWQLMHSRQSSS